MIATLEGTVTHVGLDRVVVQVGGVGLLALTTPGTAAGLRTGQQARLATTLVVREDSLTLYGFGGPDERDLFEQVQTVSGVGPRLALAMLAVHEPDSLRAAVRDGDLVALTKIPGVGKKGAERIVLELRDKIDPPAATAGAATQPPAPADGQDEVREALTGLGWSTKQAQEALDRVGRQDDAPPADDVAATLRAALRELGR